MPPGNVVGLIDLEGEAAPDFGGGGGDGSVEGNNNEGSGSERIARLSEGAYDAVMLTPSWRCRARLAAGSWLMAYWPVRTCCWRDVTQVVSSRAFSSHLASFVTLSVHIPVCCKKRPSSVTHAYKMGLCRSRERLAGLFVISSCVFWV